MYSVLFKDTNQHRQNPYPRCAPHKPSQSLSLSGNPMRKTLTNASSNLTSCCRLLAIEIMLLASAIINQ